MSVVKYIVQDGRAVALPTKVCRDCGETFPRSADYFKPRRKSNGAARSHSAAGWSPRCLNCDALAAALAARVRGER